MLILMADSLPAPAKNNPANAIYKLKLTHSNIWPTTTADHAIMTENLRP